MSTANTHFTNQEHQLLQAASSAFGEDASIISRREIEPLLDKARKVLMYYDTALNCSAVVMDRNGLPIKRPEYTNQMKLCELCMRCFQENAPEKDNQTKEAKHSCHKVHYEAQLKSRRIDGTYIYSCSIGFVYWTSPLYRNGRYAGACTAGQILSSGKKTPGDANGSSNPVRPNYTPRPNTLEAVLEKFNSLCGDTRATKQFYEILRDVPEKNTGEIQAMAQLLGVCAGEISEKSENSGDIIRRLAWIEKDPENAVELMRAKIMKPEAVKSEFPKSQHRKGNPSPGNMNEGGPSIPATGHPMEKERMLLAAFRRGDNEMGNILLKELMASALNAIPLDFEIIRFRAIELVVLLSRAAVNGDGGSDSMLETNNRYLRRIQESRTIDELMENIHLVAERMAGKIFSFKGIQHASVLRRAERFIWENYTRKISLDEIAKASGLSAPYFSTIFKEEMGENLSSYLNRLRVERASALLMETAKPLSEIASLCGFEDQSWFSKIYKNYTGVSPGKYRKAGIAAAKRKVHEKIS